MSLVITSNTPKNEVGTTTEGINRAFSYTNHLQGTLRIPTDSQIAVQSVKINKTGNAMLNENNSKFGFYFGRSYDIWADQNIFDDIKQDIFNNSLMIPAYIVGSDDRDKNFELNTDDLAKQIQKSFRKVTNCPNLCETSGITGGVENPGPLVIPIRDSSAQGFSGFRWTLTQTNNASADKSSTTWTNFNETGTDTAPTVEGPFSIIGNPNTTEPICVIGTQYPLSLNGGHFNCSLGTSADPSNEDYEEFSIGLSRCNGIGSEQAPEYWFDNGTSNIFFDWRVASVVSPLPAHLGRHEIRVYHSVFPGTADEAAGLTGMIEEVEFEYWNDKAGPRAPFDGDGNNGMIWEDEEFGEVQFEITNERVTIILVGAAGDKTICTGQQGGGDSGGDQTIKPVCPTTRWLFPKLILPPTKNMIVDKFSGVPVKNYVYGACQDIDWYNERNCDDDIEECSILDSALYYAYTDSDILSVSDLFYNQQGLSITGFMNCQAKIVSAPSSNYYNGETGLNSQYIFGYRNNADASPITGDNGGGVITFESSSLPVLVSKESIFVRLKNLAINSANFSKSAMSNILYHVPTFSNSGAETGSLHFEPAEMVYLNLNNTEDLFESTMEVDLVYGDETLCVDLSGKSVVVFHVRDK